ncbi:uncharacterized protein LOC132721065 [Ruditapes philippinarum]|uniref:uncharacterized protein LOC132721065 n=1 Tax=Ruditapes philippinarum TaxID=129788 RepID=UPI00295BC754|nr:uncharacterized protein LOC132721065 [Ruditapes philippinarum]
MEGVQENYGSVNKGQLRAVGIQSTADERQTGSLTERKKLKAYIPPKNTCIFDGRLIKLVQADIDDLSKNNTIPIGQGSFGKVFKSENPSEGFGMHIVVKKIPLIGEGQNQSITREMMASRIMHPFILPLLAVVDRPEGKPEVWFVSPQGNKGDLHGVIQRSSEDLNMKKRTKILLHIALAIQYIHTKVSKVREAVLHKDIASRNIVLDDNYNARLIDFGLARETSDKTSKASGRDCYAHPEIGKGFHAKEAWDYFAFGVIMRELLTSLGPDGVSNRYLKYMTEDEIRKYAYVKIWKPNPSEEVEKLVQISSSLLQQNNWTVSDFKENVVEELQDIWTYFGETEILQLSNDRCHVCMINPIAQETSMKQQHSCNCTQHIKACIACEKNSFLNPITCYCGTELTPVIGSRWGALLVAGTDTEKKENTKVMAGDIKEIEKLITSKAPRIIGISKEDIRTVAPDVTNNASIKRKTCREMEEENLGDNVESKRQPDRETGENLWPKVKAHIEYFSKRRDLDTLFIYFSCHGGNTENSFHLGSETDSVSLLDFQNELARLENIEKLVLVLDQCFPPKVQFKNSERKFIQINACETSARASMTNISTFTKWFITGLKARAEKSACPDNCRPCREYWQMTTDFITYSNLHKYLSDHLKEANEKCPQIYINRIDINSNFAFHTDEEVLIDFTDGKNDLRLPIGYLQDITNLKEQLVKAFGKNVEVDTVHIEKQTYRKDKEFEKCDTLEKVMQAWVLRQKLRVTFKTE